MDENIKLKHVDEKVMRQFSISRIHTQEGIFRLSGGIMEKAGLPHIIYDSAEVMGTDGWVDLALDNIGTNSLLESIFTQVCDHILE